MSDIVKYNIVNPVANKDKPFVKKGILYIPINAKYTYFVEASQDNVYSGVDYYLLLGKTKFSSHCRRCQPDGYGRIRLRLKGDIKDYIYELCERDGNCDFEYVESAEDYDVFSIG